MRLEYTDKAISDLVRLRQFIEEHDPLAANRMAARLAEGIALLREQPQLGYPVVLAPDPESIRNLVLRGYIVRYANHQQPHFDLARLASPGGLETAVTE